jgi:hypothetical protein
MVRISPQNYLAHNTSPLTPPLSPLSKGPNEYAASEPYVHGLWPETDSYGTSECIAPQSTTDPTKLATCYNNGTNNDADQLDFEQHEWEKHGCCAGAEDADDYFDQVCSISTAPLKVMSDSKSNGGGERPLPLSPPSHFSFLIPHSLF